ncbi:NUDIX domain-containing protein [Breznakia blatticola]|uniref:NUDIX domain-containing protein n=1 Tax=Breznakia blatticola TaxID=1754012 RepID=A0A4V3G7Y3_9FIRM|nr:CoA pyrophosphatase [Breznakia blatticola]TDW20834.1 NUDIX domain-containing protein [Breznakia blatticola]
MNEKQIRKLRNTLYEQTRYSGIEDYFYASVLLPLIYIDGSLHVLFEKRTDTIRQPGEISFPGGGIEKDDPSPLDTAIRETVEELGCSIKDIEVIAKLNTLILASGMVIHAYAGFLHTSMESLQYNKAEVDHLFTIPLDYFYKHEPKAYYCNVEIQPYTFDEHGNKVQLLPTAELGLPESYQQPWGNAKQVVYFYQTSDALIWGLTANIMYDFTRKSRED